ncbi:MAG TPA: hypothetical protein DCR93_03270, partial [Cytophagales bacterium]|nr:hypothetical protein [Cytophagales bacterium]
MINWEVTYAKESPRLLGLCRRYVGDLAQAEDLLHEGFLTAMSKIDQYSGRGAFEGWLRQVVLSTVLQHLRKQKGQPADHDVDTLEVVNEEDEVPTAWEPVAQNLTMDQLLAIVDQLPSHHRAVFNLYVIDGYSHKEIGKMLKISPGTSKSHLARARKKLQQWMLAGAQEEEQKKKKRRRLAFFWFILPGAKFDQAMRDRLEDLTITPQREMP